MHVLNSSGSGGLISHILLEEGHLHPPPPCQTNAHTQAQNGTSILGGLAKTYLNMCFQIRAKWKPSYKNVLRCILHIFDN